MGGQPERTNNRTSGGEQGSPGTGGHGQPDPDQQDAAGLAVPFLLLAWAVARGRAGVGLLRRHHRMLARAGGALLVGVGLAMAAGAWTPLFAPLVRLFVRSGWPPI